MRRLLPLLLLMLIPAHAAVADGCPPSTCGTSGSAMPGSRLIFVRPNGQQGPLLAFDVFTGARRYALSPGHLSADGATFVSSARAKAKRTTVVRFDARTGKIRKGWSLRGRWEVGGLTADGRRVALVGYRRPNATVIRVAGSRNVLHGSYEVEALSPDARRVFLVHWRAYGYDLQQLDLRSRTLSATRLDDPNEKMSGTAVTAVATRDGHWLLTLYAKSDGHSFVHALDLRSGLAHCVDLPLSGDYFAVGSTALTLSRDESTLYLASPYLGRVVTVDIRMLEVSRVVRFRGLSAVDMSIAPSAAVTPNGRMLAFSGSGSLWLYDTAYGVVRRVLRGGAPIKGLGFRPDGRRLTAIRAPAAPLWFDAATGSPVR